MSAEKKRLPGTDFIPYTPGLGHDGMLQAYKSWAGNYEKAMGTSYRGPEMAALTAARYFSKADRCSIRVLDIGAGTGMVGRHLADLGFLNIEALDPCSEMLQKAKSKGVYKEYHQELLDHPTPGIPNDAYDLVISCGAMGENHIPCSALTEMIRITRKGGHVCIAMREEYLRTAEQYRDKLEPLMDKLEADGVWVYREKSLLPNYCSNKMGVVYVYKVL